MKSATMVVDAVFEEGVFRPIAPVSLANLERVRLRIDSLKPARDWPEDTDEIYRECEAEDLAIANKMLPLIRETLPPFEGNE